jgi:ADP-ribose pyrophosphatase YjhB (NUDIX family)
LRYQLQTIRKTMSMIQQLSKGARLMPRCATGNSKHQPILSAIALTQLKRAATLRATTMITYKQMSRCWFSSSSNPSDEEELLEEIAADAAANEEIDFSDERFPSPPPIRVRRARETEHLDDMPDKRGVHGPAVGRAKNNTAKKTDTAGRGVKDDHAQSYVPPQPKLIPEDLMKKIEESEWNGGRMKAAQYGVLHEDPKIDMRLLMENYSSASLASALRDREDALQQCATLAEEGDYKKLAQVLETFHPRYVLQRRTRRRRLDVSSHLDAGALEVIRKALMRMPRSVTTAHTQRAGVVVPLCTQNGVPSLLLEKRAANLRSHPDEVCLPGGMVCSINDSTIVSTCLREMHEEIPGLDMGLVQVLGVLRCNWGEVHHLVGVAVTPVVCFLGEVPEKLNHNTDEVAKVFTIPLSNLLENSLWVHKEDLAPIFVGGPEVIWGLTGYILERFVKDIILPHHVRKDHHLNHHSLFNIL